MHRMTPLVLVLLTAAIQLLARPMSFLDVLSFRTVSQGALSHDGHEFAYVVSALDWKAGKRFTDIYLASVGAGPGHRVTFTSDKNETAPAFSADGQWLAFLSDRAGARQLYLLPLAGGESRRVTGIEGGVSKFAFSKNGRWIAVLAGAKGRQQLYLCAMPDGVPKLIRRHQTAVTDFRWAPDSSRIYFTARDREDPAERQRIAARFDVRIMDPIRSPQHLWQLDVNSHQESRLTSGSEYSVDGFLVSRDGRFLTFTGRPTDRYAGSQDSEAYLLALETGKVERLTRNHVRESTPRVSPDGMRVAFSSYDRFEVYRRPRIYLRDIAGGEWKVLPSTWEGDFRSFYWAADSRHLYFTAGAGVSAELYRLSLDGGEPAPLTSRNGSISATYQEELDRFLVRYDDPAHPRDYYLVAPASAGRADRWIRLSNANPQVTEFDLGEYETVRWKSTDGQTVEGLLIKPVGYEAGKRGGYAVFQPNYRGSSNYGERFRRQIAGDYFRQAFDDIMTGVDELIRRGIADPARLGMMGWSAGGHWSNWTLTHTDRFKAISTGAGAVNWISLYAETDTQWTREFYFRGKPYDNWDHYVEVSPLRYIKNAKTPTLIHCGHDDRRVPRPQSEELYMALKKLGVPVEFLVYPRMGHGITEPRLQYIKMVAEYNWFEKWIRGQKYWFRWKDILATLPEQTGKKEKAE